MLHHASVLLHTSVINIAAYEPPLVAASLIDQCVTISVVAGIGVEVEIVEIIISRAARAAACIARDL